MSAPSPFYIIVTAPVLQNKNLEANAKLLYGTISGLCNQEGYCWANNKYFSNLFEVDERTIKRWLESLKDEGFIKVEVDQAAGNSRKIFIMTNSNFKPLEPKVSPPQAKNDLTSGKKCPENTPLFHRENDPPNNIPNNIKENTTSPTPSKGEEAAQAPGSVDENLRKDFMIGFKNDKEKVERAIKFFKKYQEEFKYKNTPIGYVVTLIKADEDLKREYNEEVEGKRKDWAKRAEYTAPGGCRVATPYGIAITSGSTYEFHSYEANDSFWESIGLGFAM